MLKIECEENCSLEGCPKLTGSVSISSSSSKSEPHKSEGAKKKPDWCIEWNHTENIFAERHTYQKHVYFY